MHAFLDYTQFVLSRIYPLKGFFSSIYSVLLLSFSSVFGIGYFPKAPGTAASVAALLFVWFFKCSFGQIVMATLLLTLAGVYLTTVTEKLLKKTDPSLVVIDEWVGQWITLLPLVYLGRYDFFLLILGLVFFRFFDIKKPLGIYQLQELPGGWGIMADDVLAGLYGAILLYLITFIF